MIKLINVFFDLSNIVFCKVLWFVKLDKRIIVIL